MLDKQYIYLEQMRLSSTVNIMLRLKFKSHERKFGCNNPTDKNK